MYLFDVHIVVSHLNVKQYELAIYYEFKSDKKQGDICNDGNRPEKDR